MKKNVIMVLIVLMMSLLVFGCSEEELEKAEANLSEEVVAEEEVLEEESHYPISIVNYNAEGEEVEVVFHSKPKRVLTTNQTTTELMLDLGLEEYMIGTAYLDNPILDRLEEKYLEIPVIAEQYPTKEVVLSLEPDFIFGWRSVFNENTLGDVDYWIDRGTNTFAQRNTVSTVGDFTVDNLFKDIRDLGQIFNIEEDAEEYIKDQMERLELIDEKISELDDKKTVLIIESQSEGAFRVYGENDLVGDMAKKAGLEVIGQRGSVGLEDIISLNPEAIIYIHFGDELDLDDPSIVAELTENTALSNVDAIKNNNIVVSGLAETWAGGVRVIDAIEKYAFNLYSEVF